MAAAAPQVELLRIFAQDDEDMGKCLLRYALRSGRETKVIFYIGHNVSMDMYTRTKNWICSTNAICKTTHEIYPATALAFLWPSERVLVSVSSHVGHFMEDDGVIKEVTLRSLQELNEVLARWPAAPPTWSALISRGVGEREKAEMINLLNQKGINYTVERLLKFGSFFYQT